MSRALLVKKYETENFEEIPLPDPIAAIKIRMGDLGLKPKDLVPAIDDKGTVSKVLNRKIPLSLRMIRNLTTNIRASARFWNFSFKDHDRPYFVTFTVIYWLDVYIREIYRDIFYDSVNFCQMEKDLRFMPIA